MNQRPIERGASNIYIYIFFIPLGIRAYDFLNVLFSGKNGKTVTKNRSEIIRVLSPPQQVSIRFTRGTDLFSLWKFPPGGGEESNSTREGSKIEIKIPIKIDG